MRYDVAIIGGGAAGLTAAIYSARAGLNCAVYETRPLAGGQAALTENIENFPAFLATSGFDLTQKMQEQAQTLGANFVFDEVKSLSLDENPKKILTSNGVDEAGAIILCMGAAPKKLGVLREDELTGHGISYCATCDGGFFKNKSVVVVGGGNTAVADALYLKRFASEVTIVHRREGFRASVAEQEKLRSSDIKQQLNCVVTELLGDKKLSSIKVKNVKSGEEIELKCDGLFVAVGQTPSSELSVGVDKDENGYIKTARDMSTNLSGVYAAGDVRDTPLRQIITACADGAVAAESAAKFLTV